MSTDTKAQTEHTENSAIPNEENFKELYLLVFDKVVGSIETLGTIQRAAENLIES